MACYLGDQAGWLSRDKRCFFTRSGRRVSGYPVWLIARHSLRHSTRANTVVVYTDTQKKVRFITFLPSDMMHVQSSEETRTKMPISKGR